MGLRKNVRKTVGVVCRPFRVAGVQADKAYTWRMKGEGRSFKERQWEQVLCLECRKDKKKGSLVTHRQTQHGLVKGGLGPAENESDGGYDTITYSMAFPVKVGLRPCPVEGCSVRRRHVQR